ncbi:MAG: hypothetical protein C4518_08805 [Desulfobacteraceae bacterium]|nr:MAG: hypothetical protein C4518_08805 [Desulfobacteraceae bacterium]
MKKRILLAPVILILLVQCTGLKEQKIIDAHRKSLEIALSFNTENYPWLMGTKYPQIAVWVTTGSGDHETVFVTQGAGRDKWMFADERPGALPVWSGIRPTKKGLEIDAVSGATPSGEVHTIRWEIPEKYEGKDLTVFIEANVSFDYNDYYSKAKSSPGYSDVNGQPSVVWRSAFRVDDNPVQMTPEIAGHGHVLGKNSAIDSDMTKITTAAELFNYINIAYHPGS